MSPELDDALVKDFPLLFCDRRQSMMRTAMCWGFECGDGWEPLIRAAAEKLEPLIQQFIDDYPLAKYPPRATQVKEKYGTLRFYLSTETPEMSRIVREAENKSEATCELCGKKGKVRGKFWYYTACSKHTKKEDK